MLQDPMQLPSQFPIRRTVRQKRYFREAVTAYAEKLGYTCNEEEARFGGHNLVIGDPERAEFLITAHYDTSPWIPVSRLINPSSPSGNTSGIVTVLEILRTLPEMLRAKVCFVLFDLNSVGMKGSKSYRDTHKTATDRQIVLNLDTVGDGDELVFFPTKVFCSDRGRILNLCRCVGRFGTKTISIHNKGFRVFSSDHKPFPYGVGIAAFPRRRFLGLNCSCSRAKVNTNLDQTNVNILRAALTSYISGTAAQ